MKPLSFFSVIALACITLFTAGCSSTGTATAGSTTPAASTGSQAVAALTSLGWDFANAYESVNTGGVLTQAIAKEALTATKSDPTTTAAVLEATSIADTAAKAAVAAHDAGATPQGIINTQTAVLSDSGIIQTAATTAAAQASIIEKRDATLVAQGKKPLGITPSDIATVERQMNLLLMASN